MQNKARGLTDAVNRDQHSSSPVTPPLVHHHILSFQINFFRSAVICHLSVSPYSELSDQSLWISEGQHL